jgi:hypothetical protein
MHQDGAAESRQDRLSGSGVISPWVESISSWSDGNRPTRSPTVGGIGRALFNARNTSPYEWNTGTLLREKFQKIAGTRPECGNYCV